MCVRTHHMMPRIPSRASMNTILITGGNSGIGLQAARDLLSLGHRVLLLGRDQRKGDAAVTSFGETSGRAAFLAVDLSTHAGVREAAKLVVERHERLDAAVHCSGVLTFEDERTADGLHPFFAVNYLSRYHLTQLLLPALRLSDRGKVVMVTSKFPLTTRIDFQLYPKFEPFNFFKMTAQIQIGNHHYAAHLAREEPSLLAGVINAGAARTGIWRKLPWYVRTLTTLVGPLLMDPVTRSAANPVAATQSDDWASGTYWEKPGKFERKTAIDLDAATTQRVMSISRELTGI